MLHAHEIARTLTGPRSVPDSRSISSSGRITEPSCHLQSSIICRFDCEDNLVDFSENSDGMLQFMRLRDVTFLFLFASTQLVKSSASQKTRYLSRVPPHLSLSLVNYDTGIDRTPESVRNMLNHNLYKVLSGKRAREFAESYSKATDAFSGAYTNIVSTHGRSTNLKTKDGDEEVKQHIIEVLSELEKQFQLPPPSFFTLCARATRLGWNFAPCIATCGLAYMSSAFRTGVWYRILTHCIAKSGPAFIKWGKSSVAHPCFLFIP